jgi:hypothetical protein
MAVNNVDRYLRVTDWAKRRYTNESGMYITQVGNSVAGLPMEDGGKAFFVPSVYSLIEDLAASKFLGCKRRFPNYNLKTAYR